MKRRRETEEVTSENGSQLPPRKSRKTMAASNLVEQMRICQEIMELLRAHRVDDGRLLCEKFLRIPSRRISPEYYKLVSHPLDIMRIQQKLKTEEYNNVEQFVADVKAVIDNAKSFFKKNSQEYKDASELWHVFLDHKTRLLDPTDEAPESRQSRDNSPAPSTRSLRSNSPGRSVRSKDASPARLQYSGNDPLDKFFFEEYLASLTSMTDENSRNISVAFRCLPSRKEYPEYYRVIGNPIDLLTIARKLRDNHYRNLNELHRDFYTMCRNAKIFNEPKSTIYKDANLLKKAAEAKKSEILEMASHPIDKQRASRVAAAVDNLLRPMSLDDNLEEEEPAENFTEDSDEDFKVSATHSPYMKTYLAVRLYKEKEELPPLSDPFCRLPSKVLYPDYYDEIKNPISLFMVNRKMKSGEYDNYIQMVDDINLIFNNAKVYNIEESPIFIAACKLQALTNKTAQEINPNIDLSRYNVELPSDTYLSHDADDSEASMDLSNIAKPPKPTSSNNSTATTAKPTSRYMQKKIARLMDEYRDRLLSCVNIILEHQDSNGRRLSDAFMEKPSRKLYPDYYDVIPEPIDLKTIKTNVETDQYDTLAALTADVELLFNNARHYNEEASLIYADSNTLELIYKRTAEKFGENLLSPQIYQEHSGLGRPRKHFPPSTHAGRPRSSCSTSSVEQSVAVPSLTKLNKRASVDVVKRRKMWMLYEAIKNHKDSKGRVLSTIFIRLPSKAEYPNYYDVIKKPVDLQKIHRSLMIKSYESFEALIHEFNLMFDNACQFNDPESTIYKDALALRRVLLQKKAELQDDELNGRVPDVPTIVQELLTTLFITVYNHEDEEGRCFSDSLSELPDLMKDVELEKALLSLDDIKQRLDKGRYKRMDRFQEDFFSVLDKARQFSHTDSQLFEDAMELQQYFIKTRDDLCKNGDAFWSPALLFTNKELMARVEEQKSAKQQVERKEEAEKPEDPRLCLSKRKEGDTDLESVTVAGLTYVKGDFAFVKPNEEKLEPHIIRIERIWSNGLQEFISGNWFYRPYETYHLATRKFLEKEVFRTEFYDGVDIDRLTGKCYVMFIKDYFKYKPQDFDEKDVFVCESKYLGRVKHFKKIKYWHIDMENESVKLVTRTEKFSPLRVPSIFANDKGVNLRTAEDRSDEEEDYSILDRKQQEILDSCDATSGNKFYKKLHYNNMWLKLGDAVYVEGDLHYNVVNIDRLWRTPEDKCYLEGRCFVRPQNAPLDRTIAFYRQELLALDRRETVELSNVTSKCHILNVEDYKWLRPTEVREQDVYICESIIRSEGSRSTIAGDDLDSSIDAVAELPTVAPFTVASAKSAPNLEDEIWRFKKPVRIDKQHLQFVLSSDADHTVASEIAEASIEIDTSDLLKGLQATPKLGARSKSGYILFSAVVRKRIMADNPSCSFGDISKIVGQEWKKLSDDDKKRYEEEANKIAEQRQKADQATGGRQALQPGQIRVHCCKWRDCDYQFETSDLLFDHITTAHTSQIVKELLFLVDGENQYVCLWLTCAKYRKDGKPFPSLPRLHRHIKDKHLPAAAKCIFPQNKSRHFITVTPPQSSTPQVPLTPESSAPRTTGQPAAPHAVPYNSTQVMYYQHQQQAGGPQGTGPVLIDSQGNMVPGQQVVIYQVQQPGQPSLPNAGVAPHGAQMPVSVVPPQSSIPQGGDPGRLIVHSQQRAIEPVFVAPPQRVQRVAHSEIYLRYLEGLSSQSSVTPRWDRSLSAKRTVHATHLPMHIFRTPPENREQLSQALCNLRERLMKDACGLKSLVEDNGFEL